MSTTKRYGKSSSALLNQKTSFFDENEILVKMQQQIASIYKKQSKRINCKNCDNKLEVSSADFTKSGVDYVLCSHCHHLNGIYEDTDEFCRAIYTADSGEEYAKNYKSENRDSFNYRTASLYLPKAEFLYTSLLDNQSDPHDLEYFDFGAGSGYFVTALKKIGLKNVSGTDVSAFQVDLGNTMIGEKVLTLHNMKDSAKILGETKSQVVSMIGVLEHLQYPRKVLNELRNNNNVEYIYLSVPTFSLSVYLEIISPEVFHRQLQSGHTHLYTEKSLSYLCKDFGFEIIAEWWFGTDIIDLYRHISVKLEQKGCSKRLKELWQKDFVSLIDSLQLEIDKMSLSSEVHLVLKKVKL
jgi:hypothetical protein